MGATALTTAEADGNTPDVEVTPPGANRRRIVAGFLIVTVLFVGVAAWQMRSGTNPVIAGSTEVNAAQLEDQYGVRIDVIGLLASGGLLELRFQVTDADKATALFGEVEDMPVLAVEGTDKVLWTAKGMKHQLKLHDGGAGVFLYGNVANAVHEGSNVAFVINGVRLAHLTVMK